jgi:hypothetical protein
VLFKPAYILLFTIFLNASLFSQDLQKQLMANKWFVSGTYLTKLMTLSPNPIPQPEVWEAKFQSNGKIKKCDSVKGSLYDKDGKETKMVLMECDSAAVYKISKDVIQITSGSKTYFFRSKPVPNGLEFTPVKEEDFSKK